MNEFIKELLLMFCCGYFITAFLIIAVGMLVCYLKPDDFEKEKDI